MTAEPAYSLAAMNCSHRFYDLEEFFSSAAENGYQAVELWTGPMHFYLDYAGHDDVSRLRSLEDRYGIKVIGICPEQTNPKPNNVASRDESSQRRVHRYFCNAIDVACEIGADQVVVTAGWGYLNEPVEDAFERSLSMLSRISAYAERHGMTLAIEALQPDETNLPAHTATELARIIGRVGSPALKACIDTGAMWRMGETVAGYFDVLGADVVHSHFVDAGAYSHVAWGDGNRDMARDLHEFADAGYAGHLSVEIVSSEYFADPAAADRRSMRRYQEVLKEEFA
jgi:protein FrlC